MNTIDQHKVQQSLVQALIPDPCLIDSRTTTDHLRILTEVASLINFYDRSNSKNGDWSPFLLKDPVFLVASIAKTSFQKVHTLFINTCAQVSNVIPSNEKNSFISNAFNQIFEQLIHIFQVIERWTHYMLQSSYEYNLKTYIIGQVQQTYSQILWALLEFETQLNLYYKTLTIIPVNTYLFQNYDQKIWKDSKGKMPFWTVLGLPTFPCENNAEEQCFDITKLTENDIYTSLQKTGETIFNFFNQCISYAQVELENVKELKAKFPDTLLLRTFTELLIVYKNQINRLSQKHLQFYYNDILKQHKRSASADTAFICSDLAKKTDAFLLPIKTLFAAGQDANKNPIVFETTENVSLNPATIVDAYTLTQHSYNGKNTILTFNQAPKPGVIAKDENGNIQKWKTFGSQLVPQGIGVSMGFAFASPLLFLSQEATERKIIITYTFSEKISVTQKDIFEHFTQYYLSTKTSWFEVSISNTKLGISCIHDQLILTITLGPTDPAIVNFKENPDGYKSAWPLYKMVSSQYEDPASPTIIKSIKVKTTITESQDFQLYSDFGALSTKKPFQPFGPTPNVAQNFIMGSAEAFSKPLDSITLNIDWNAFPANFDFSNYYTQYNEYLKGTYCEVNEVLDIDEIMQIENEASDEIINSQTDFSNTLSGDKKTDFDEIIAEEKTFFQKISQKLKAFSSGNKEDKTSAMEKIIFSFSNSSFQVNFQLLQNAVWDTFKMSTCTKDDSKTTCSDPKSAQYLFSEDGTKLSDTLIFNATKTLKDAQKTIDPSLQNTPLELSDTSTSGYVKMQLITPKNYGFGAQLYPKVVSAIALYNAEMIANKIQGKTPSTIVSSANPPFTPVMKTFTGNYIASHTYKINDTTDTYPLECFYYSPFQNYQIYDNTTGIDTQSTTLGSPVITQNTLPLFPIFNAQGQLFLELENVIAPAEISFYFELAREYSEAPVSTKSIKHYYLSEFGWKLLDVIVDGTNNFTCSGIITFNIPADITTNYNSIPSTNYWIAIATDSDPDSIAQTTFLKTNGITVKRVLNTEDYSTETPSINANVITGPETAIPEVSETIQPFPSFGGVGAETTFQMNERVSTRINTKDRLVTTQNYFNMIRLKFPEVYFSKTMYDSTTKQTNTYVVQKVEDVTASNAFLPLVSECTELHIEEYIENHVSAFVNVAVSNFNFQYLKINAEITLNEGYEFTGVVKEINNSLNIFLSPWILTDQEQITIDKGINTAQVAAFINTYESVLTINSVSMQLGTKNNTTGTIEYGAEQQEIIPTDASVLLVPSLNNITNHLTIGHIV